MNIQYMIQCKKFIVRSKIDDSSSVKSRAAPGRAVVCLYYFVTEDNDTGQYIAL